MQKAILALQILILSIIVIISFYVINTLNQLSIEVEKALLIVDEISIYIPKIEKIINRMKLLFGDSKDILPQLSPEVIMIDTMYRSRKKTALAKNNMR